MSDATPERPLSQRRRDSLAEMIGKLGLGDPKLHGYVLTQLVHVALDADYLTMRLTLAIEELTEELRIQRKGRKK